MTVVYPEFEELQFELRSFDSHVETDIRVWEHQLDWLLWIVWSAIKLESGRIVLEYNRR